MSYPILTDEYLDSFYTTLPLMVREHLPPSVIKKMAAVRAAGEVVKTCEVDGTIQVGGDKDTLYYRGFTIISDPTFPTLPWRVGQPYYGSLEKAKQGIDEWINYLNQSHAMYAALENGGTLVQDENGGFIVASKEAI